MKKVTAVMVVALCISSCAMTSGPTKRFPKEMGQEESATVFMIMTGPGSREKVMLDGFVIAIMNSSYYVKFNLPPGSHSIGAPSSQASFDFEKGKVYYFKICLAPYTSKVSLERLDEDEALRLIEKRSDATNKPIVE